MLFVWMAPTWTLEEHGQAARGREHMHSLPRIHQVFCSWDITSNNTGYCWEEQTILKSFSVASFFDRDSASNSLAAV